MGTTARPRPTTTASRARASARARADATTSREEAAGRDEYDLLTAMLMGVAIGTTVTLLLRRGPRGHRPGGTLVRAAGKGAVSAGRYSAQGARWAADRGSELWDRVPREQIAEEVGDYLSSARTTINNAVSDELRDLRKSIRRQRKRIGI